MSNFLQLGYKGSNRWWMYGLTLLLVFIGIQFATIPLSIAAYIQVDYDYYEFLEGAATSFLNIGMNSNLYLFLMIFTFIGALCVLYLCIRYLHKKDFKDIITSREKIDWNRVVFAFLIWGFVAVLVIGAQIFLFPENYIWNFKAIPFFTLVVISFLFLPFQTSTEEIIFRGYLMQGFAVLSGNRWFPLLTTSIIFGALHLMNPEVEKLGYISMVFYIGNGLFYGITTLMDEGLELALGLHAVNNIVAAFFVTTDWTVFQTDALYIDISEPSVNLEMYLPVFVLYPFVLGLFWKRYEWQDWQSKLFGRLEKPIAEPTIIENEE